MIPLLHFIEAWESNYYVGHHKLWGIRSRRHTKLKDHEIRRLERATRKRDRHDLITYSTGGSSMD